jgi:hypothetical protein
VLVLVLVNVLDGILERASFLSEHEYVHEHEHG